VIAEERFIDLKIVITVSLELTKPELTLITKSLCGKLRPEEVEAAGALGIVLLTQFNAGMTIKAAAAAHALQKANEEE